MSPVLRIALGALGFAGLHLLLSHPPIRRRLAGVLGEAPFRGVYSLAVGAPLALMTWAWWTNPHAGEALWVLRDPVATHGAELLIALGLALALGGAARPAPSSVAGPRTDTPQVRGWTGLTRHPVGWGLSLLALGHMLVNGWPGDLWFWGGFAATGLLGSAHQDWRMRRDRPGYAAFAERTTFFPIPGRGTLAALDAPAVIGAAIGLGTAVVLRLFHDTLFG